MSGLSFGRQGGPPCFFLLKCLEHLKPDGRLAFILPADVCEGVSSSALWARLCQKFRLDAVLTFAESAAPFPKVDTNALVFLLSNNPPKEHLKWIKVCERDEQSILDALSSNKFTENEKVMSLNRTISEALTTGLSRPPRPADAEGIPLSRFARVVRGIASGANEFFFLTRQQIQSNGLDPSHFIRAVGRTRDCQQPILTVSMLDDLDRDGRPTWLLNLDNTPKNLLPKAVQKYLSRGEQEGVDSRALIQTRNPWFKMEQRQPPPLLFAYLGRRDSRFILNQAGAVPLTGFLCVYPDTKKPEEISKLWQALNHPATLGNLLFAGKSYGGGAVKVEPRQLDTLVIPEQVLKEIGLKVPRFDEDAYLLEKQPQSGEEETLPPANKVKYSRSKKRT